jgi:hypothetical protein
MKRPFVIALPLSCALLPAAICFGGASTAAQTKPSDVFFSQSPDPAWGLNLKPAQSIVAKGVTVRGWLERAGTPSPFSQAVFINDSVNDGVDIGYEDVHYDLVLDNDFIVSTYGTNLGVLNGAMIHGNPIDSQTISHPIQDAGADGKSVGVDINSFWLPNAASSPVALHTELNAWHQRGSKHCGFLGWFCGTYRNYAAMGPAPSGWIEKEYSSPLGNLSADNWWPFDPDNPDEQSSALKVGDYVEIQGALWQDTSHDSGLPTGCWSALYPNHDGALEIHPVDSLRRVAAPGPSPLDSPLQAAYAGVKHTLAVNLCSDAQGAAANYTQWVCPEQMSPTAPAGRTRQPLAAHFVELIDGRFSAVNENIVHGGTVAGDCVSVAVSWSQGLRWARYKATFVVWWTPAVLGSPTLTVSLGTIPADQGQFNLQLDGKNLATAMSEFPATTIPNATFPNLATGQHVITVSASGSTQLKDYNIASTGDCHGAQGNFYVNLQNGDEKVCTIVAVKIGSIVVHPPKP